MINAIVAVDKKQGIGFNGSMPWPRLQGDMQWFKDTTINNVVVMGSVTWKSIGKYLANRINVVISSTLYPSANLTFSDPVEAIQTLKERYSKNEIFIIGGQSIYNSTKELVDKFYVTEINATYECDKFFNLEFVKDTCPNVRELLYFDATETTPAFTIKEYTK
jgi:dihydrofolate reductase